MLKLCKTVLRGVQEDEFLFRKELKKSLSWLNDEDKLRLQIWVEENFYHLHKKVIEDVFYPDYVVAS